MFTYIYPAAVGNAMPAVVGSAGDIVVEILNFQLFSPSRSNNYRRDYRSINPSIIISNYL